MFWWFSGKKEVERVREDVKESFELVKKDMNDLGEWIKHLNSHKEMHKKDIESIRDILSSIKKAIFTTMVQNGERFIEGGSCEKACSIFHFCFLRRIIYFYRGIDTTSFFLYI